MSLINYKKHRKASIVWTLAVLLPIFIIALGIPAVQMLTDGNINGFEISFDYYIVIYIQVFMALIVLQLTFATSAICERLKLLNKQLR